MTQQQTEPTSKNPNFQVFRTIEGLPAEKFEEILSAIRRHFGDSGSQRLRTTVRLDGLFDVFLSERVLVTMKADPVDSKLSLRLEAERDWGARGNGNVIWELYNNVFYNVGVKLTPLAKEVPSIGHGRAFFLESWEHLMDWSGFIFGGYGIDARNYPVLAAAMSCYGENQYVIIPGVRSASPL